MSVVGETLTEVDYRDREKSVVVRRCSGEQLRRHRMLEWRVLRRRTTNGMLLASASRRAAVERMTTEMLDCEEFECWRSRSSRSPSQLKWRAVMI